MRLLMMMFAAATFTMMGCGDGDVRNVHLSGKVTYDGKPVPHGVIVFTPDAKAGNTGPQGTAVIENGEYDTKANGKGVIGGAYDVMITGTATKPDPNDTETEVKALFPPFKTKKTLPEETGTLDFTVE